MLLLMLSQSTRAQYSFDVTSVEAYISDHKRQRSLLLARSTLEAGNKLLHEYSAEATHDYKELNVELDRYTRAFDVIDIIYQSVRTAMNVHSTYNTVSDRVGDYREMMEDYMFGMQICCVRWYPAFTASSVRSTAAWWSASWTKGRHCTSR